jgi:hypothetical protein
MKQAFREAELWPKQVLSVRYVTAIRYGKIVREEMEDDEPGYYGGNARRRIAMMMRGTAGAATKFVETPQSLREGSGLEIQPKTSTASPMHGPYFFDPADDKSPA